MKNFLFRVALFAGAFVLFVAQLPAGASGVGISLSDGVGTLDASDGGQIEITTSFTSSGLYATGTYLDRTISPAATSTVTDCTTPDYNFAGSDGALSKVTSSWSTTDAVFSFAKNISTSTAGSVCVSYGLTNSTPTNYSISVLTST